MKVVLFCGGLGLRIRGAGENVPKPLVTIGGRPILWHVMKYYAHFGHKDFVICLGHAADTVRKYFLDYNQSVSNDFMPPESGRRLERRATDIQDWRITFVDTGLTSNIGQRLRAVEQYVRDEPEFLANYSDGLTNLPLPLQLEHFRQRRAVASFVSVKPQISYHIVTADASGRVTAIQDISQTSIRVNGGYFIFTPEVFNYVHAGEELVDRPFHRLLQEGRLTAYEYDGFWMAMDTFKDRQLLEETYASDVAPWEVWNNQMDHRENDGVDRPRRGSLVRSAFAGRQQPTAFRQ